MVIIKEIKMPKIKIQLTGKRASQPNTRNSKSRRLTRDLKKILS